MKVQNFNGCRPRMLNCIHVLVFLLALPSTRTQAGAVSPPTASDSSARADRMPATLSGGPLVVFGDSTTAPREGIKIYSEALADSFLQKGWAVKIVNSGLGGNTTRMARERLEKDVLSHRPSTVIIQFGINDSTVDVWQDPPASEPRVPLTEYRANLEYFVDQVRQHGADVILMTPNVLKWTPSLRELYGKAPYDPADENGFNAVLTRYAQTMRDVAREKNVALIDVHAAYLATPGHSQDALLLDGMHPSSAGHDLVKTLLLKQWMDHSP